MTTDTHKAAFAAAAAAARELIGAQLERRAKIATQLSTIDAEIARLQTVISFDESPPATPPPPGEPVTRPKKHDWVAAIGAVLVQYPMGLTFNDLVEQLRKQHAFDHSKVHIQKLLETGEKKKVLYRDDERRWHIAKDVKAQTNGTRKTPWHALPGANA